MSFRTRNRRFLLKATTAIGVSALAVACSSSDTSGNASDAGDTDVVETPCGRGVCGVVANPPDGGGGDAGGGDANAPSDASSDAVTPCADGGCGVIAVPPDGGDAGDGGDGG